MSVRAIIAASEALGSAPIDRVRAKLFEARQHGRCGPVRWAQRAKFGLSVPDLLATLAHPRQADSAGGNAPAALPRGSQFQRLAACSRSLQEARSDLTCSSAQPRCYSLRLPSDELIYGWGGGASGIRTLRRRRDTPPHALQPPNTTGRHATELRQVTDCGGHPCAASAVPRRRPTHPLPHPWLIAAERPCELSHRGHNSSASLVFDVLGSGQVSWRCFKVPPREFACATLDCAQRLATRRHPLGDRRPETKRAQQLAAHHCKREPLERLADQVQARRPLRLPVSLPGPSRSEG